MRSFHFEGCICTKNIRMNQLIGYPISHPTVQCLLLKIHLAKHNMTHQSDPNLTNIKPEVSAVLASPLHLKIKHLGKERELICYLHLRLHILTKYFNLNHV